MHIDPPRPDLPGFADYPLPAALVGALAQTGIDAPFAIQTLTLADALAGKDILGRARTGSGKTLAFCLPMLARLGVGHATPNRPRGLVLVPTRELAAQVADVLAALAPSLGLSSAVVVGGVAPGPQLAAFAAGADIVVATPGRLIDHVSAGAVSLERVEVVVVDEADHMADLGFTPQVTWLLDRVPRTGQRMLFSATLDGQVDQLVRRYLSDPVLHAVDDPATVVDTSDHYFLEVRAAEKVAVAAEIANRDGRTLFFVRTKSGADRLTRQLLERGLEASAIHGDLPQARRNAALEAFAAGRAPVLVATDVAARGIHVDGLDLVVHFDPPEEHKSYLHRSGRTARAGECGTVVTLVLPDQAAALSRIRDTAGLPAAFLPVGPGDADLALLTGARPVPAGRYRPLPQQTTGRRERPQARAARAARSAPDATPAAAATGSPAGAVTRTPRRRRRRRTPLPATG